MREFEVNRETKETEILAMVNLDGSGIYSIETPYKFLNHMLELFTFHSGLDLTIKAYSLDGLQHHLVEDIAITLGSAIKNALGDKQGINRYGSITLPMDETLVSVSIDLSGRNYYRSNLEIQQDMIEDLSSEMVNHFLKSFTDHLHANLHVYLYYGENGHHKVEGVIKALARALKAAVASDFSLETVASTKGVL